MKKLGIIFLNTIIFSTLLFDITIRSQILIAFLYLIYLCLCKKVILKKNVLIFSTILIMGSILNILRNGYTFSKMIEQVGVVFIILLAYYNFFLNYDIKIIWNKYLKICYLFAIIGIFQILIYYFFSFNICNFILKFLGYYNENNYYITKNILMCSSLSGEPGMYAQVIMPATFFSLENIFKNKKISIREFIILSSYFLSYVAIAYFGLILYFFIKLLIAIVNKEKKKLFYIFLLALFSFCIFINYFQMQMIKQKISETFLTLFNVLEYDLHRVNLSTFALMSNLRACILSNNYYLGNGIGTIEQVYYRFFENLNYYAYGLNATDGYSLGVRILSEFGLIGIITILFIISKNKVLKKKNYIYNTINLCSLIGVLSYLIRGGSYFMHGTLMFYMFLIFSKKNLMEVEKDERNNTCRRKWNKTLSCYKSNIKANSTNL